MILVLFSSSFLIIPKGIFSSFVINSEYLAGSFIGISTRIPCCLSSVAIAKLNPILLYDYLVFFFLLCHDNFLLENYFSEGFHIF